MASEKTKEKIIIGWREWVSLPKLKIGRIKAKIDTGARSSSLHAVDLEFYKRNGNEYVKFKIFPEQKNSKKYIKTSARVIEYRKIKSSNGYTERRPVISTEINLMGQTWSIEITLTNRDEMGFRMLLGREGFRNKMLVDAGKSYYGEKNSVITVK
ncbi:MAG: ATP-dependent zinc protease [Bdellovibrionales bacterium]